jgi:hypothetical protein
LELERQGGKWTREPFKHLVLESLDVDFDELRKSVAFDKGVQACDANLDLPGPPVARGRSLEPASRQRRMPVVSAEIEYGASFVLADSDAFNDERRAVAALDELGEQRVRLYRDDLRAQLEESFCEPAVVRTQIEHQGVSRNKEAQELSGLSALRVVPWVDEALVGVPSRPIEADSAEHALGPLSGSALRRERRMCYGCRHVRRLAS